MTENFLVLIVDDNSNNLYVLKLLLSKLSNVDVIEASSGEEALMQCVSRSVHLILLDVHMPKMDGYETARHLQMTEKTRVIPIVFLTAHLRSEAFIQQGYAIGAVDYLTKPIDDNLLLNRVRHYQHLHDRETKLWERTQELQNTTDELQNTLDCLQTTQVQLVQSEKLAALGRIVAVVAHELNTPIGNCLTVVSTLEEKHKQFDKAVKSGEPIKRVQMLEYLEHAKEAMALISRGLGRASELVDNFKQIAVDQENDARKKFEFRPLIDHALSLLSLSFKSGKWDIKTDIQENIWMDSYPVTMEQIISILFENAIVHGFEKKSLGNIALTAKADQQNLFLSFSDDGCGMSEVVQQHIFDPFFTTKLGQGSSGLGMSICYNLIVGVLGGHISVISSPGKGSTFVLEIPLNAPKITMV